MRDIYALDAQRLLIVTTDRLSAFDVVLPDPIPGKGRVLDEISRFWFARTASLIPNHLTGQSLASVVRDAGELALLEGRAVIVKRLRALPLEAVVRGYLIGSGWKDYQAQRQPLRHRIARGPAPGAATAGAAVHAGHQGGPGQHDQNISFDEVVGLIGAPLAEAVRSAALAIYAMASEHARARGIIIADTKFEFGVDDKGQLMLIDEVLTPDSSRFWPADTWRVGTSPPSFDKQFVRDYLETLDWNKRAPGPHLPADIIARTSQNYREALRRLTAADGAAAARHT